MEKLKRVGMFDLDINTLPEVKSVKDILNDNEKIEDYFSPVDCVMKKRVFKSKDGSTSDPVYSMIVNFNDNIEEVLQNKSLINKNEFSLLGLEFLKPVDCNEIRFTGYIRFLRGQSDNSVGEDKTFTILELFITKNLSTINSFLSNGTKLVLNRFSLKTDEELRIMKAKPLNNIKQYKLVNNNIVADLQENKDKE